MASERKVTESSVPAWIREAVDVFNPSVASIEDLVGSDKTLQEKR